MALIRALGVALAAALVAGILASSAPGVVRPAADHTLTTTHFVVNYYTDVDSSGAPKSDYATETDAGQIAGYAEQAYALYTAWGFAPPPDDGDGHIDIYINDLAGPPAEESIIQPDAP